MSSCFTLARGCNPVTHGAESASAPLRLGAKSGNVRRNVSVVPSSLRECNRYYSTRLRLTTPNAEPQSIKREALGANLVISSTSYRYRDPIRSTDCCTAKTCRSRDVTVHRGC